MQTLATIATFKSPIFDYSPTDDSYEAFLSDLNFEPNEFPEQLIIEEEIEGGAFKFKDRAYDDGPDSIDPECVLVTVYTNANGTTVYLYNG